MLYWMCKKSERPLTGLQLQHAIKRNFGGLDVEEIDTYGIFKEDLRTLEQESDLIDEVSFVIARYVRMQLNFSSHCEIF